MDKNELYNTLLSDMLNVIHEELNRDYSTSDFTHVKKTRILNRSFNNGKVFAYLEMIDKFCGAEYLVKAYAEAKEFIETSIKITNEIYQYLSR